MKRLLSTVCILVGLTALLVPATLHASPPAECLGTVTHDSQVVVDARQIGGNMIVKDLVGGVFTGSLTGVYTEDRTIVIHPDGHLNVQGILALMGSYAYASGTVTMRIDASGEIATGAVQGHWVILRATGDLANLNGQGTFSGNMGGIVTYSGHLNLIPD